jgi:small subunit ribosomal protein S17
MKTYQGIVIKQSGLKTIAVEVTRKWVHPKYQKTVKRTKKYLVHDPDGSTPVGSAVRFIESKPISKRKRFILITPNKGKKPAAKSQ